MHSSILFYQRTKDGRPSTGYDCYVLMKEMGTEREHQPWEQPLTPEQRRGRVVKQRTPYEEKRCPKFN